METNIQKFKEDLKKLIARGELLRYSMALDLGVVDKKTEEGIRKLNPPSFKAEYEQWYSLAMQVVKQILPDRFEDFKRQYRDEKRKSMDHLTYGVADYMIGLQTTRGGMVLTDAKSAFPKFDQQLNILKSAETRIESSLYDMVEILQAEFFDDELEAAKELNKKGFIRGAGAVAGVVLEKHLGHVCSKHGIKITKKHPTINDYNQILKDANVIDTPTWRFIQHLGDLRNLCDHDKERDPKKEEVYDLIAGVSKITMTIF
jgi:hypothetical protein